MNIKMMKNQIVKIIHKEIKRQNNIKKGKSLKMRSLKSEKISKRNIKLFANNREKEKEEIDLNNSIKIE